MSRAFHRMRGFIGGPIVIVGTVTGNTSSNDGITHPLGNINVGAASSDKQIILGITWEDPDSRNITSLTVGGVNLSEKITQSADGGTKNEAAIWTGNINSLSGSQAISVTFTSAVQTVGVSGVAVSGLRSLTPTMFASASTVSSAQLTINSLAAQANGIAFACGITSSAAATATWGSLTERADVQTGGGGEDHRHTAAWNLGLHSAANETLDFTAGADRAVVGAGFR